MNLHQYIFIEIFIVCFLLILFVSFDLKKTVGISHLLFEHVLAVSYLLLAFILS